MTIQIPITESAGSKAARALLDSLCPQTESFLAVEELALNRPEFHGEVPPGIPDDELGRIQKWRASNRGGLSVKNAATDEIELAIIGIIGGGWMGDGITARSVRDFLNQNKSAKNIRVLIDSPGGDAFDGIAIMNQLKRHPANVVTEVIGEASSAGSIIAMAGSEVLMHDATVMMIHRTWTIGAGNADQLRVSASLLDKLDDGLATLYAARTGKEIAEVEAMMAETTFMTAEEAVNEGFADRVIPAQTKAKPAKKTAAMRPAAMASERDILQFVQPLANRMKETSAQAAAPTPTENEMTISKKILAALNLTEEADEASVVAAIERLKTSANTGSEIEVLLGATGGQAIGAVRALKETQTQYTELSSEIGKLKAGSSRRDFEAARASGLDKNNRKLSPATAKLYTERFEAALAAGQDGSTVVEDLVGFLKVAPRLPISGPGDHSLPSHGGNSNPDAPVSHNGVAFEAMKPMDRKRMKDSNPELYETLREDAVARQAI